MDTDTKTEMKITITLTAKEAIWLKGLVQNAQCHPDEESAENSSMRAVMFDALPSFQDLYRANRELSPP